MKKANHHQNERVFHSNGADAPAPLPTLMDENKSLQGIKELSARLKKMSTTDDGKLQIMLEAEVVQQAVIMKIRDLFLIQQGRVFVDFAPDLSELISDIQE